MEHRCVKEGVLGELTARIDNMERRQEATDKLVESVHSMATEMTYVKDGLAKVEKSTSDLVEKLEAIKDRPFTFLQKVFWIITSSAIGIWVGKMI